MCDRHLHRKLHQSQVHFLRTEYRPAHGHKPDLDQDVLHQVFQRYTINPDPLVRQTLEQGMSMRDLLPHALNPCTSEISEVREFVNAIKIK